MPDKAQRLLKLKRQASLKRFDPEGDDYDYKGASAVGMKRDKRGHMGSLGKGGLVLKGRKHKTWGLMEREEHILGNMIIKKGKRYYSVPATPGVLHFN